MLELKNLTKTFYQKVDKVVVNNLSLKVKKGEVFGFLGLNGAGKTTTVKMIVGLLFPDKGSITISKDDHLSLAAKQRIGYMPESPQFYQHLTVAEVLRFAGQLYDLELAQIDAKIPLLLQQVGLAGQENLLARQMSKGMHQRLAFAVALINDPELLILDEPLDGLDPLGRLDFKKLINSLKKQGKTVFFSTHILSDVEEICDQVAILDQGKIIRQGTPKELIGRGKKSLEEVFVEMVSEVKK